MFKDYGPFTLLNIVMEVKRLMGLFNKRFKSPEAQKAFATVDSPKKEKDSKKKAKPSKYYRKASKIAGKFSLKKLRR